MIPVLALHLHGVLQVEFLVSQGLKISNTSKQLLHQLISFANSYSPISGLPINVFTLSITRVFLEGAGNNRPWHNGPGGRTSHAQSYLSGHVMRSRALNMV